MFNTIAGVPKPTVIYNTHFGYDSLRVPANPLPVTIPILAHIVWIIVIKGNAMNAVHNVAKPNIAPACEYVAIPDGSSSLAPVIMPGPKYLRKTLMIIDLLDCF